MSRRLPKLTVALASLILLAIAMKPAEAANYHIGSTTPADGVTYFDNLQQLYAAHPALANGDIVIMYRDDNSLVQHTGTQPAFTVTGIVSFQTAQNIPVTINGRNIADRLFYVNANSTLNIAKEFTFTNFNSEHNGVMTVVGTNAILNAEGVKFINNYSGSAAAGVDTTEFTSSGGDQSLGRIRSLNLKGAYFENNTSAGGGIWPKGSAVIVFDVEETDLTDAIFINNLGDTAGAVTAIGGSSNMATKITMGATTSGHSYYAGNYSTDYVKNISLYFRGPFTTSSVPGSVELTIFTDEDGELHLLDPIYMDGQNLFEADIVKKGTGTWNLGGVSLIDSGTDARNRASITVTEGTLNLLGADANYVTPYGTFNVDAAEIHMTGDNDSFTVEPGAIVGINGGNVIQGTRIWFEDDAVLSFSMDAFFRYPTDPNYNPRNQELLYLQGTTLKVSGTLVDIMFPEDVSFADAKGDYMLVRGASNFAADDFTLTVNGTPVMNKRFGFYLDQTFEGSLDQQTLVLHVDETTNTVLVWNNPDPVVEWNLIDKNFYDDYYGHDVDTSIPNDSVIFGVDRFGGDVTGDHTLTLSGDMFVSKDANRQTGDWGTGERGMRVSGTGNWTFDGGSIGDNYDPAGFGQSVGRISGPDYLAALVFDGSGTLTLNNDDPNTYHDGTIISGGGILSVKSPDSLGSTEYAGFSTTGRLVQDSGYGIEFLRPTDSTTAGGGRIIFQTDGTLEQRIGVGDDSSGILHVANTRAVTVTVDDKYQGYAPDPNGGAVNVGANGSFQTIGQIDFTENATRGDGGAIWAGVDAQVVLSSETVFNRNTADGRGGAIHFVGGTDSLLVVGRVDFSDNSATSGGAIYIENGVSVLNADRARFLNNEATAGPGGAIYARNVPLLTLTTSEFYFNTSSDEGGAIYIDLSTIPTTVNVSTGSQFFANEAALYGGAIRIQDGNTLNANGASFVSNLTTDLIGEGGAIYAGDEVIVIARTIDDSTPAVFNDNSSALYGGAIRVGNHSELTVDNARFLGNYLTGLNSYGGAISAGAGTTVNANTDRLASTTQALFNGTTGIQYNAHFGGAISIVGTATDRSGLISKEARYINNTVENRGGALYLEYTDVDISGSEFTTNTAENEGGAIYYRDGAGNVFTAESATFVSNSGLSGGAIAFNAASSVLNVDSSAFRSNTAVEYGGAIWLPSDGILDANGAEFTANAAGNSGGAVYAGNRAVVSISEAAFTGNEAVMSGGAIHLGNAATLIADTAFFASNSVTGANGIGGAIRVGNASTVSAKNGFFIDNHATGIDAHGGAIALLGTAGTGRNEYLDISGTAFQNNSALGNGGAVYSVATTTVIAEGASFAQNSAFIGNGGALYLRNTDVLHMKNATVLSNSATGKGGGIYFAKDNGVTTEILLGTSDQKGWTSYFSGNTGGGGPASIYFDVTGTLTNIALNIDTPRSDGLVNIDDPFVVDTVGNRVNITVTKTGDGIWQIGGTNDLKHTAAGTTVDVNEGTFSLNQGAQLLLTNVDKTDYLNMLSGTHLIASGTNRVETTYLAIENGTTMRLDGSLTLNIVNDYTIGSTLFGVGAFIKEDAKVLRFHGQTIDYRGNVSINGGTFDLALDSTVPDSGHFTTTGHFDMSPFTTLQVVADGMKPTITAQAMNINLTNLNIAGLTLEQYEKEIILLHTTEGIVGNFNDVRVGGTTENIDFLTYNLGFLNDRKDYGGTIGLRWYSTVAELPAHGTFTLNGDSSFTVNVALNDNTVNLQENPKWDGKSLTKNGTGTLILAAQNAYTGTTTINGGELVLTHAYGTGVGAAAVRVNHLGSLVLDFNGTYEKSVNGAGQLIKRGNGIVDLTGTNTNSGGTVLEGGVLGISRTENIGLGGSVLFMGGILQNNAEIDNFNRSLVAGAGQNIQIDTQFDMTVLTPISDSGSGLWAGGLIKTGNGMLTLKGVNTYNGATSIRGGTVKLDGSVVGDVRVSNGGAIGGGGRIGGDLFIYDGGAYEWFFGPTEALSPALNVNGSVTLYDGSVFRPRTAYDDFDFTQLPTGWTVLRYDGTLSGEFATIDNRLSPFFDFELDYSVPGEVRVAGTLLSKPKTLSDSVTTSLVIANRRMNRHAFAQLDRETTYSIRPMGGSGVRGQSSRELTRSAWFAPTIRANRYASMFHVDNPYWFESYGMQAGSTVWSNQTNTVGATFGYERGLLHNYADSVRAHDYYLGVYTGHIFSDAYEVRSFLGGGYQDFTSFRNDGAFNYVAKYKGSSFEGNIEFARLYVGRNGNLLRPFVGLDFEYAHIETGEENEVGYEFRQYPRSSLTQFFARVGAKIERRWTRCDIHGSGTLRGLLIGPVRPEGNVFYPTRGTGSEQLGARMGSSGITLNVGGNWYLDQRRTAAMFLDYTVDMFFDNDADAAMHTGNIGLSYRF